MKINHFWSPKKKKKITSVHHKRGKNHFQKKFENISVEKQ